jgi:hypothetical protein
VEYPPAGRESARRGTGPESGSPGRSKEGFPAGRKSGQNRPQEEFPWGRELGTPDRSKEELPPGRKPGTPVRPKDGPDIDPQDLTLIGDWDIEAESWNK